MVKEYSFIPSYWSAPDHACPATHFFKSVEIRGRAVVVEDAADKARALQALMEKMQPEGSYVPLDHALPMYRGAPASHLRGEAAGARRAGGPADGG